MSVIMLKIIHLDASKQIHVSVFSIGICMFTDLFVQIIIDRRIYVIIGVVTE